MSGKQQQSAGVCGSGEGGGGLRADTGRDKFIN